MSVLTRVCKQTRQHICSQDYIGNLNSRFLGEHTTDTVQHQFFKLLTPTLFVKLCNINDIFFFIIINVFIVRSLNIYGLSRQTFAQMVCTFCDFPIQLYNCLVLDVFIVPFSNLFCLALAS